MTITLQRWKNMLVHTNLRETSTAATSAMQGNAFFTSTTSLSRPTRRSPRTSFHWAPFLTWMHPLHDKYCILVHFIWK